MGVGGVMGPEWGGGGGRAGSPKKTLTISPKVNITR